MLSATSVEGTVHAPPAESGADDDRAEEGERQRVAECADAAQRNVVGDIARHSGDQARMEQPERRV